MVIKHKILATEESAVSLESSVIIKKGPEGFLAFCPEYCHCSTQEDYYRSTCRKDGTSPAAVAVIQTFGGYLSSNTHIHILTADGCFSGDGFFYAPSINIDTVLLEKLFIYRIFKMLLSKGLITERVIELIGAWKHTDKGEFLRLHRFTASTRRSFQDLIFH